MMPRLTATWLAMAIIVGFAGCLKVPQDPDDPEDPVWNSVHPGGPGYVVPKATITSGPADGAIHRSDRVTYVWNGTDGVARYQWTFDGVVDSGTAKSATFANLEEGTHVFSVAAEYPGDLGETPPDSIEQQTFAVRAFPNAAIYTSPRLRDIAAGQPFLVDVRATRFAAGDTAKAKAIHLVLKLPANVTYVSHEVLGLLRTGGTILDWAVVKNDSLTIDCAGAGVAIASPSDSGVVRVRLNAASSVAAIDSLRIVSCDVRNAANRSLRLLSTRGAKLVRR